jgi:hypothetical protein
MASRKDVLISPDLGWMLLYLLAPVSEVPSERDRRLLLIVCINGVLHPGTFFLSNLPTTTYLAMYISMLC